MGGGRTVKGGREGGREGGAAVEKSSVLFFFHSWLVLALLLWRLSTLPVLSFNSLKTEEKKNLNSKQCPGQMNKAVHTN